VEIKNFKKNEISIQEKEIYCQIFRENPEKPELKLNSQKLIFRRSIDPTTHAEKSFWDGGNVSPVEFTSDKNQRQFQTWKNLRLQ